MKSVAKFALYLSLASPLSGAFAHQHDSTQGNSCECSKECKENCKKGKSENCECKSCDCATTRECH